MIEETQLPPKPGPACSRCHWWDGINSVVGKCKRMPPAAHFDDGRYWPITGRADWCGEFKQSWGAE